MVWTVVELLKRVSEAAFSNGAIRGVVWFRVKGDGGWDDRYDKAFAWYAPCFHWSLPAVVTVYVYGDPASYRTVGARTKMVCLWKQMRKKFFLLICTSIICHSIIYIPWRVQASYGCTYHLEFRPRTLKGTSDVKENFRDLTSKKP